MFTFVGVILVVGLALAAIYIGIGKPGDPNGKTITAPQDGAVNPPSR